MDLFFTAFALMVAALLPIMNPATSAALFLGICGGFPPDRRAEEAARVGRFVFATLLIAWVAGAAVLSAFGVSLPGLRLAGGLVVSFIGFRMLFPSPSTVSAPATEGSPAFVPLTIPSLCGPGTLALVLSAAVEVEARLDWPQRLWVDVGVIAAFAVMALVSWGAMRLAGPVARLLGPSGVDAMTRVLGFLLICMGMQFLIGAREALLAGS